jgi:MinD superfamily P-loop ATPase
MIISIASGKGGTGKTTVATNLAYSLGDDVQILDCDVEEPNVHLFLKPEIDEAENAYTLVPKVDNDKCTLCRQCVDICRFNAITAAGETILTFEQLCHSCRGCIMACPEKAIIPSNRELGVIERGHRSNLKFVQGRLKIGEAMAPPLVKRVKAYITEEKVKIIDAPPGTSCPVISAIKGTDFVLMVTEPTPFGLHDLKLAVEAVRILGIPHGLVINRSDLGDDKVNEYAEAEKIPVLMEIPFDRKIAEIYSKGHLLTEELPEWQTAFRDLYKKIETLVVN